MNYTDVSGKNKIKKYKCVTGIDRKYPVNGNYLLLDYGRNKSLYPLDENNDIESEKYWGDFYAPGGNV